MQFADIGRCLTCGLVQKIPMPTEKETRELYDEDIEHFEPYLAQIAVHRKYFRQKLTETGTVRSLLDIGCAMGVLLEEAKKQGIDTYGVDVSADAVAYCRKKGLHVSENYPKKQFDAITAFEVLEHERDPLTMIRRVYKLLNNDGITVLTTPNHSGIWQKIMGKQWVSYRHPEHVTFWDEKSLRYLFSKVGFTKITIRHDDPRPFPLSFLFTRAADYFPWISWLLKPLGKLLDRFDIINPVNPWDDLVVYARK